MKLFLIICLSILCFSSQLIVLYIFDGNLLYRYLFYALIYLIIPLLTFRRVINKKTALIIFLIPALFTFFVSINAYLTEDFLKTMPLSLIGIISLVYSFLISRNKNLFGNIIIYLTFILASCYIYYNWLTVSKEAILNSSFSSELNITDFENKDFNISSKKGKVLVFDLWSSTCAICFVKFPAFEKLSKEYENDSLVELFTLNLPLQRDSIIDLREMINEYEFKKLFSNNLESWKILDNYTVPKIIILDKNGRVRYKGSINNNNYLIYNNFHNIIDRLKNE